MHFKPDWNRDLFFSQNYVSHLGVYKASLLRKINGFRLGVEGSQDQDLLLRCLLHITDDQIIHVPKVLYHWRALEGSTALAASEKSYTSDAGIKALVDYFNLAGLPKVEVTSAFVSNTYRVTYPLPDTLPLVSMLIPTRDKIELLRPCVESILAKTHYQHFEILILDNGSIEPETLTYFKTVQLRDERVKVITYNHPFNYSAINNFGAKHAKGEILALINNDIEVINPEWLDEMVRQVLRPDIGCVGAKLYFDDDTIQHAGVVVGLGGVAGHSHKHFPRQHPGYFGRLKCVQNYLAVTAACLLVRKSVYEQVGGLNEADLKVAFNDVDFCLKVYKAGYRNLWTPYAELYHYESKSRGVEDTPEKQARFQVEVNYIRDNWLDLIEHDPCYSIYLTRSFEDFSVKLN
ncbi:glycosyltransferase family 2 protein [Alishewanella longhuensis]